MTDSLYGPGRSRPFLLLLLLFLLQSRLVSSIQVTPNSPCSSLCIDSSDLDESDPNSSNTNDTDITCEDADFSSSTGQKWESCMECLQNSTYSQGSESDQAWFFYNLRYNFAYCIFGYPNATDIESSPCQTSSACGNLENAMTNGIPDYNTSEYDYCSVDSDAMTGSSYDTCLACVSADGYTNFVANALVALEAGCLQQNSSGLAVGLNETVFSSTIVSIVSPSSTDSSSSKKKHHVATTTIVVVVVVAVLFLAAVAGFVFVCYRKRANHRRGFRTPREATFRKSDIKPKGRKWSQYATSQSITSPLSFQCRSDPNNGGSMSGIDEMADLGKIDSKNDGVGLTGTSPATDQSPSAKINMYKQQAQQQQQQHNVHFLPSIVESPFPSPAPAEDSKIDSIATVTRGATAATEGHPKLNRLDTTFLPSAPSQRFRQSPASAATYQSAGSTTTLRDSPDFTPTSATDLLSFASQPALSHPPAAAQPQHAPYVPAAYVPGASAARTSAHGPPSGLPSGLPNGQPNGYYHPLSATSSNTSPHTSPMPSNLGTSGHSYAGWSSVAQPPQAHQAQHHQNQQPPQTSSPQPSSSASPRPPSVMGLGSATMAARYSVASTESAKEKEASCAVEDDEKPGVGADVPPAGTAEAEHHRHHRRRAGSSSGLGITTHSSPVHFGRRRGSEHVEPGGPVQTQIKTEFPPPPPLKR